MEKVQLDIWENLRLSFELLVTTLVPDVATSTILVDPVANQHLEHNQKKKTSGSSSSKKTKKAPT